MRREALAFLLENLKPVRARVAATLLLLAAATLLEGVGIGLIVPILESIEGISPADNPFTAAVRGAFAAAGLPYSFPALMAVFGAALLSRYLLEAAQQHLARSLGAWATRELREKAFANLMEVPLSYYYGQKTGDLLATVQTSTLHAGGAVELLLQALIGALFIAVYVGLGLLISLPLTLASMGLACLSYFLIIPKFRAGFTQGQEEKDAIDRLASFLVETLGGIKTVKTFHNEARHSALFSELARAFQGLSVRIQDNRILAGLCLEPLNMALVVALVVFSVSVLRMPVAYLLTFFYIFSRLIPRIRTTNTHYLEFLNYLPHLLRVKGLAERAGKAYLSRGVKPIAGLTRAVVFDSVGFRYPGAARPALDKVRLRFEKNRMTAIIGPSGGGKTTLVDLLLGHHEPQAGAVLVDGTDLREIRKDAWHRLVSMVEQDAHLFNLTIFDNIAYGRPGASSEEVERSARLAHAHDFIAALPEGYGTRVGERGIKLSGGQRQRIALARALIRDPEILILDEATSALDTESERLIQRSIEELSRSKTLVVIAHRLSTIAKAERLYVLEGGAVVEEGAPQALLKSGGAYEKYHRLQLLDDR